MIQTRLITGIFIVAMSLSVQAGVYKWTDAQGRIHYGDKPSTDEADEVKIRKQVDGNQAGQPAARQQLQERFLRSREEERAEKKKAKAEEKRKQVEARNKCAQAKKDYDRYRYASSIYLEGKGGEREHLSFKEREAYEKSVAAKVKKWCK